MFALPFFFRLALVGLASATCIASLSAGPRWRTGKLTANLVRGYVAHPLAVDNLRPQERSFLEKALEASREQAQLARLAQSQAVNSTLRSFAQQLAVDQRTIGDAIDGLRRKKGAVIDDTPRAEIVTESYQRLAARTGADFDREFVRVLSELQSSFMALFEEASSDTKDPDVRDLAAQHLTTLRGHQSQLVSLRKALE